MLMPIFQQITKNEFWQIAEHCKLSTHLKVLFNSCNQVAAFSEDFITSSNKIVRAYFKLVGFDKAGTPLEDKYYEVLHEIKE